MTDKKEPWAGVEKARGKLINALGDMNSIDVVTLANVRDAIDGLIMERLAPQASATHFEDKQTLCPVCKRNWISGDESCDH